MECVRSGHVGGVNNDKYLHENEIYFPKEHRFIVLLLHENEIYFPKEHRFIVLLLHENEIYFPKEYHFIVLLLQHGRCEHTLYYRRLK